MPHGKIVICFVHQPSRLLDNIPFVRPAPPETYVCDGYYNAPQVVDTARLAELEKQYVHLLFSFEERGADNKLISHVRILSDTSREDERRDDVDGKWLWASDFEWGDTVDNNDICVAPNASYPMKDWIRFCRGVFYSWDTFGYMIYDRSQPSSKYKYVERIPRRVYMFATKRMQQRQGWKKIQARVKETSGASGGGLSSRAPELLSRAERVLHALGGGVITN
jgi:hypothetical protein